MGAPLLAPDIMSFDSLPPLTLGSSGPYPFVPSSSFQSGPDPDLNAAIIVAPCPSGYRRDFNDVCRLKFGYGPNPFYSFTPGKYKGDVQFYMGLQVTGGGGRRRGRGRRPRPIMHKFTPDVKKINSDDDDD
ncbi:hypothetical protein Pcinc_024319 [Petrolisthes cinctipes]|uniref:Uncharacterized protein n=1 Tax=Petrolisthes cinctipes TaxID=88211 RepID=A0AAE1KEK2_PETCI|nr:hypothetical protein Pcinc_024319 [Petrolisthes cinctipes]